MSVYQFDHLWRSEGWMSPAYVAVDASGFITSVGDEPPDVPTERISGYALPGIPNLHSHAFQRAMSGLTEHAGGRDTFWSWREAMYNFLERLGPDQVEAIAAELYVEMLEAGYTSVGEFHYLHHDPTGRAYENPGEMSERLLAAARRTGIGITLMPALYVAGGFGGAAPEAVQKRFANSVEWLLALVERLARSCQNDPDVGIGIAPHSLRAVPPAALRECIEGVDSGMVVHIHVAEQVKEVEDSKRALGKRPVEWLLTNLPVDSRFCLVHATHVTPQEIELIAKSGAVVAACPTTEANLGDGIAPAAELVAAGVKLGIGSDSHVSLSPTEELRWLEYTQRLANLRRNVLSHGGILPREVASTGECVIRLALSAGAQALGRAIGEIRAGARADWVVLDPEHPVLIGRPRERVLDAWIFANQKSPIRDVMVGGRWVVRDGVHRDRAQVLAEYRRALAAI